MYRVLMPIDDNEERATTQAKAVADLPGEVEAIVMRIYGDARESGESTAIETASGQAAAEILESDGVIVTSLERAGDPAEEILAAAQERGVDQIVLGGRKRSPLGSLLFGSVTQEVILDSSRPVTVTGAESREQPSHECTSCGEAYYTDPDTDIEKCRRCGGTKVEKVRNREEVEA
jgi:nucleotide-binding universal stress UspA family protein